MCMEGGDPPEARNPYRPPRAELTVSSEENAPLDGTLKCFSIGLARSRGSIIIAWILYSLAWFVLAGLPQLLWRWFELSSSSPIPNDLSEAFVNSKLPEPANTILQIVGGLTLLGQIGLSRVLRSAMLGEPRKEGGVRKVFLASVEHDGAILVSASAIGIMFSLGMVLLLGVVFTQSFIAMFFLVPVSVAAFFMTMGPYLAAVGIGIRNSFTQSFRIARLYPRRLLPIFVAVVASLSYRFVLYFALRGVLVQSCGLATG